VLVAFYRQQNLLAGEALFQRRTLRGLGFIPFAVVFRSRMNIVVVGSLLTIFTSAQPLPEDVWRVFASYLRQGNRLLGCIKCAVAESFLHVNENIGKVAIVDHDVSAVFAP